MGGESVSRERIDRAISAVDQAIGAVVDAVLHDPRVQALESAWRGLAFAVGRVDFTENVEVAVWGYSKEEAVEDFGGESDVTRTRFFREVYTAEYGQHGGRPYGALCATWDVSSGPGDVGLLRAMASVAAMAHAPLLVAASPELLRIRSLAELQSMTQPQAAFEGPGSERWASLRAAEDSRYVGVLLPRVLMRNAHGEMTPSAAARFVYEERTLRAGDCLWGSPVFAFAVRMADTFARYRSFVGLVGAEEDAPPLFESHPALGPMHAKPPLEVMLSRRLERGLGELGLIPIVWDPVRTTLRIPTANSVQLPKAYGSAEGGNAATVSHLLGTRLSHLMLACRFAHYLKVLERERIGGARERVDIERDLNAWISEYVVVMDAPPATRLKYPLRNARVTVTEVEGSPRIHRMELKLQPHLRYARQAVTLSVSGRLEAR